MIYRDCLSLQTQTLSITESKQVCICKPAKIQYNYELGVLEETVFLVRGKRENQFRL